MEPLLTKSIIFILSFLSLITGILIGRIWNKISINKKFKTIDKKDLINKNNESEASETLVSVGNIAELAVKIGDKVDLEYEALVANMVKEEGNEEKEEIRIEKPDDLVRKAAGLKNNNLGEAIILMRKVVAMEPEEQEHYYRLSSYLHAAGEKEEAFGVLELIKSELDFEDVSHFNNNRCLILEKKASLLYKDKSYEDYLINYGQWLVNRIISFACSGKEAEMKDLIKAKSKFGYLAPAKVEGALKRLDSEDDKVALNKFLTKTINSLKADALGLVKIVQEVISENEKKDISRILWGSEVPKAIYLKLNDDTFFYNLEVELSMLVGKEIVNPELVSPEKENTEIATLETDLNEAIKSEALVSGVIENEVGNEKEEVSSEIENQELVEQIEGS